MFDFLGLVITGFGLLLSAISLTGLLSDKDKIKFFELIFRTEEAILRDGQIFEQFLKRFPAVTNSESVTKIMPRRMDSSSSGRDCFSSVYYLEGNQPSQAAVASESEVKAWAYKTTATLTGIIIAFIGFCIQVFKYASVEKML